ncbi:MAG TPA: hypothetical protein IAB49_01845 [Candidatus Caccenecus avistercoris]|nr:hypothetical protein [Candidatus Caccenecus avistercoris]
MLDKVSQIIITSKMDIDKSSFTQEPEPNINKAIGINLNRINNLSIKMCLET